MKKPSIFKTNVDILEYRPEHQPWFEKFNRDWIEEHFWMEPIDFDVLQHPEDHIINKGGFIYMATCDKEIAGTVALKFVEPGVYEFTKMAVDEKFRGLGIGRMLSEAAIEMAKALSAKNIILYSNRKLETAIKLYKKLGFLEVPVDGTYARSNIKMKLVLDPGINPFPRFSIRKATIDDAHALCSLGRRTFEETFAQKNTEENMKLYLDKNFIIAKLEKELEDLDSTFLLVLDGHKEIGYAKMRKNVDNPPGITSAQAIELERIYITKAYHGKQAGHELLQACIDLANHEKHDVLWLGVWEQNTRAISFYEKYGFQKFGSHTFALGSDVQIDLLMKKNI